MREMMFSPVKSIHYFQQKSVVIFMSGLDARADILPGETKVVELK